MNCQYQIAGPRKECFCNAIPPLEVSKIEIDVSPGVFLVCKIHRFLIECGVRGSTQDRCRQSCSPNLLHWGRRGLFGNKMEVCRW
jgi:hypothetical protein